LVNTSSGYKYGPKGFIACSLIRVNFARYNVHPITPWLGDGVVEDFAAFPRIMFFNYGYGLPVLAKTGSANGYRQAL
jgi:hypothetical protein